MHIHRIFAALVVLGIVVAVMACGKKDAQSAVAPLPPAKPSCGYAFEEETDHDAVDIEMAILRGEWMNDTAKPQRFGLTFDDRGARYKEVRYLFKQDEPTKVYKTMESMAYDQVRLSKLLASSGFGGFRIIELSKRGVEPDSSSCATYAYSTYGAALYVVGGRGLFQIHSDGKRAPVENFLKRYPKPIDAQFRFVRAPAP